MSQGVDPQEIESRRAEKTTQLSKQTQANRQNATKSKGPTSDAGKARSSQNARKHHIFVSKIEPVQDGFFAEDPDEFYERVELIVQSLRPRDAVEFEVATRYAGVLVKLERLDRWSSASISGAAVITSSDLEAGARSERKLRVLAQVAFDLDRYLTDPNLLKIPPFESFASFIKYHGPGPAVAIKDLWDDTTTPGSADQWRRAFETLKAHYWASEKQASAWAADTSLKLVTRLEEVEDLDLRIAANRILNGPFELQIKYEGRLLTNLKTLQREYMDLQQRDLQDG